MDAYLDDITLALSGRVRVLMIKYVKNSWPLHYFLTKCENDVEFRRYYFREDLVDSLNICPLIARCFPSFPILYKKLLAFRSAKIFGAIRIGLLPQKNYYTIYFVDAKKFLYNSIGKCDDIENVLKKRGFVYMEQKRAWYYIPAISKTRPSRK